MSCCAGIRPIVSNNNYWSAAIGVSRNYVQLIASSWTEKRGYICQYHSKLCLETHVKLYSETSEPQRLIIAVILFTHS